MSAPSVAEYHSLLFGETDVATGFGAQLEDIEGEFISFVGETLDIEDVLAARAAVRRSGWTAADRIQGRSASSQ